MIRRKDIVVRDPYIMLHDGIYYMYVTNGKATLYYRSCDLENWESGGTVFEIPPNFWAYKDVWAGEVHKYKDKFYLFVSLLGKNGLRGTQIAVSDVPEGPFVPLIDRAVTPAGQSCIDGTLLVSNDKPYIFYSRDWPDNYVESKGAYVGEICVAELSENLVSVVGDPWVVFTSDEVPISKANPHHIVYKNENTMRYGSDGPFVQKLSDGRLLLIWSPYINNKYVVLSAISESGDVKGPWTHIEPALYGDNGGHAMLFYNIEGKLCMCLHSPECEQIYSLERAHIFELGEKDGKIKIMKEI